MDGANAPAGLEDVGNGTPPSGPGTPSPAAPTTNPTPYDPEEDAPFVEADAGTNLNAVRSDDARAPDGGLNSSDASATDAEPQEDQP